MPNKGNGVVWRRWAIVFTLAAMMLFAGAVAPQQSEGAWLRPSAPMWDDEVVPEGCNLYCPDSRSEIVWTSPTCAICCWKSFPYSCSSETCC
jgi:hypothetical protein